MTVLKIIKYLVLLLVVAIVVLLAVNNREDVVLNTPWADYNLAIPVYILILTTLLLGVILGGFTALGFRFKSFTQARRNKRKIEVLENEISALKIDSEIIDADLVE